jgi:hypothetical protein
MNNGSAAATGRWYHELTRYHWFVLIVAALGPFTLGLLTSEVFAAYPEPMRYAGITMCSVFLLGLLALPFAPETRDQPLPD